MNRGNLAVLLYNFGSTPKKIGLGEAIAQLTINPMVKCIFKHTSNLESTERGERGFGSTDRDERTDKKDARSSASWDERN